MKESRTEDAAVDPRFLDTVSAFGQKHAKLLVFVCSLLVVLIVLLIANYFWHKARYDRGLAQIAEAASATELEPLREQYSDLPEVHSRLLVALGDRYFREGKLAEARRAFDEFKERYARHSLVNTVDRALNQLRKDQEFMDSDLQGMLYEHSLYGHPAVRSAQGGPEGTFGPKRPAREMLEIETTVAGDERRKVTLQIEIYEQDAVKAAGHLLDLVKKDYFKGGGWEISPQGDIIRTTSRPGEAAVGDLPLEVSNLPIEEGAVMLVPGADGKNQPGRLQIALRDLPELTGQVTVVGYVIGSGKLDLKSIQANDLIRASRLHTAATDEPAHDHDRE